MKRYEWRKDRWYWVRFKFAAKTLTIAQINVIIDGNPVGWWLANRINFSVNHDDLEIISEIQPPEGY